MQQVYFTFSLGDEPVQKVNGVPVYWLGNALGALFHSLAPPMPPPTPPMLNSIVNEALNAKNQLDFFVNQIGALSLSVTAAKNIMSAIDKVFSRERFQSKDTPIRDDERNAIVYSILNFQAVLNLELPNLNVFYITPKRAYDMTILINSGEKVLSENILSGLGQSKDFVLKDIREATKCIALSLPTAVGFHVYRAVEAIIVNDYFRVLGVPITEYEKNQNMGHYIIILEKYGVDAGVVEMLKHLKNYYRNPIMHPQEFWTPDKAESAFNFASSAMGVMVEDVRSREVGKSLSPPTP